MLYNLINLQSQLIPGMTDGGAADTAKDGGKLVGEVAELKSMSLQDLSTAWPIRLFHLQSTLPSP